MKAVVMSSILIFSILLTSCSNVLVTEKDQLLFNKINELEDQINEEQWKRAHTNIKELQHLYFKRKWKIQLLGIVDDTKEIEIVIEKLKLSVQEEDELETKMSLKQIEHLIRIVYEL